MNKKKFETNLRVLKRSKRKPEVGDIFTFQLTPLESIYFFGRVVKVDARIGNMNDVILIYIYKATSTNKNNIPDLRLDDLMFAPEGINALPWSKGYFETIKTGENKPGDVFNLHCFKSVSPPRVGWCFDEYGNKLDECFEPCGQWGMAGYGTIDKAVSQYMGIPSAS
jgi:hypothetical protein